MDDEKHQDEVRLVDVAPAIEFCCWTVVVLAPCLRLVNGPAVTNDQWWIQLAVFSSALLGGLFLRSFLVLNNR